MKGNPYLYEQTTYRDCGRVKIKNIYIGRAGSAYSGFKEVEIILTINTTPKEVGLETSHRVNEITSRF